MRTWRCRGCGRRFNALTCTTLQGIHGSWRSIVLAVYCSIQFPQYTGLSMACALKTDHQTKGHHTVLRLKHHIFQAMEEELPPFSGICQLDDTLIGTVNGVSVSVIGCVEQESGQIRAEVIVGEINKDNSTQFIKTATTKDAQLLTDQSGKYPYGLRKRLTVNHSIPEMARWIEKRQLLVTTNTIESFWALLKSFLRIHRAVTYATYICMWRRRLGTSAISANPLSTRCAPSSAIRTRCGVGFLRSSPRPSWLSNWICSY